MRPFPVRYEGGPAHGCEEIITPRPGESFTYRRVLIGPRVYGPFVNTPEMTFTAPTVVTYRLRVELCSGLTPMEAARQGLAPGFQIHFAVYELVSAHTPPPEGLDL